MRRVVWSDQALAQLEAIKSYIEQFNPSAAAHVAAEMVMVSKSLASFPHRGRRVANTLMRELVMTYPYIIRYRIEPLTVRILRVRHTAR